MPNRKKKNAPDTRTMMTVAEVSNYLSLSAASVYRLVGDLRATRVGGRWCFPMSEVEQWLLKQRSADEPQIEPVKELGSRVRLFSHINEANVFLDVSDSDAPTLIRNAIDRAQLDLTESPEQAAKERIYASIMERETLCSTALHPNVAFPHPREPEKCPRLPAANRLSAPGTNGLLAASLGSTAQSPPPPGGLRAESSLGDNGSRVLRGLQILRSGSDDCRRCVS
jgi:excisionase family DNA binding protein